MDHHLTQINCKNEAVDRQVIGILIFDFGIYLIFDYCDLEFSAKKTRILEVRN